MRSRLPFLLPLCLAAIFSGCALPDDAAVDDVALDHAESELALNEDVAGKTPGDIGVSFAGIAQDVVGLSSEGVYNAIATVDQNLDTSTPVTSYPTPHCPVYNGGSFIWYATHCLGPGPTPGVPTYFRGWEMVTFQLPNGGNVESIDVQVTHWTDSSTARAKTIVYTSWDGRRFTHQREFPAANYVTTRTVRVTPPTTPSALLWVVLGKSETPTSALRWHDVVARSNYIAAPGNLTAQATSWSTAQLNWVDTSTAERDFEVYMQEGAGAWRSLGLVPANRTSEPITQLNGNTTYSFKVRARSASGATSPFSNIATVTTPVAPPGSVSLTNNSGVDVGAFRVDGLPRNPNQIVGNQALFTGLPAGNHAFGATLALLGRNICDWNNPVTVIPSQTVSRTINPPTAGQMLTRCGLVAARYAQGGYVDGNGVFHSITFTFNTNNTYAWTFDGILQPGGTINAASTIVNRTQLSFNLSSGDHLNMFAPFGTLDLNINGFVVRLLRQTNW
ncbi:MAG: fibronectin type III domain-containing protein [Kofleriaceae bacterium]